MALETFGQSVDINFTEHKTQKACIDCIHFRRWPDFPNMTQFATCARTRHGNVEMFDPVSGPYTTKIEYRYCASERSALTVCDADSQRCGLYGKFFEPKSDPALDSKPSTGTGAGNDKEIEYVNSRVHTIWRHFLALVSRYKRALFRF